MQDDGQHLLRLGVLLLPGLQRAQRDRQGRLPATVSLALGAGIFWLLASIALGTLAAVRSGKYTDRVLTVLSMIGVSMPPFLLGAVIIYYVGYKANLLPLGGYVQFGSSPWQWFKHLIGPWFTLSVLFIGFYSRVLRSSILDTMSEDYVRTARAKGLSERRVLVKHILRMSLLPIISLWGLDMAQVIGGGAILTETIYSLHGVGQLAATGDRQFRHGHAALHRDADRVLRRRDERAD
jgi:peptide/nickel transport system permease protein